MANGYIKLHRKIIESPIFGNESMFRVWIWCLCRANYLNTKTLIGFKEIDVLAGHFITGRKKASTELGMAESTFWRNLKALESMNMVELKTDRKWTDVSIVNWSKYQGEEINSGQIVDEKRTDSGHSKEGQETNNKQPAAATREKKIKKLVSFYETNNFGVIPHSHLEDMAAYLDEGASASLIERCMKEAVDNQRGAPTWAYAKKVLERCIKQKIETVEQFEAEKAAKEAERTAVKSLGGKSGARQKTNEELAEELFAMEAKDDGTGNGQGYICAGTRIPQPQK